MLKKIIATGAICVLFACTGKDNYDLDEIAVISSSSQVISSSSQGSTVDSSSSQDDGDNSSSSQDDEASSSSSDQGPQVETIQIASFNNKASELFGSGDNFPYGFTLKADTTEDLTQFWDMTMLPDTVSATGDSIPKCPTKSQQTKPKAGCELVEKKEAEAILQNTITNQYSDLHYDIVIKDGFTSRIGLTNYNIRASGDQAALGLSVGFGSDEGKTVGELGITKLNGIHSLAYTRQGGVHKFRAIAAPVDGKDRDFWEYEVPASAEIETVEIPLSDFKGMGSFADSVSFDISKVAKFLWVIEYDSKTPENNQGSLLVSLFKALKMPEQ